MTALVRNQDSQDNQAHPQLSTAANIVANVASKHHCNCD
eukprot:CAMPEP_0171083516 /NCGR_PEP_ID=MMETSP0766_2-20121228/17757_1 /TAXON_ID=439317 /ORGANISM="Gambierdiscus australes, Strain CAWD 149" /LENGTH=38 /DNA_ID= /DNA_START= /DNA_END= /DNA_ORIENTATION=